MSGPVTINDPNDPLSLLVNDLLEGMDTYVEWLNRNPHANLQQDHVVARESYAPAFEALEQFEGQATSLRGVRDAIELALDDPGIWIPSIEVALRAALGFLDAVLDEEAPQ